VLLGQRYATNAQVLDRNVMEPSYLWHGRLALEAPPHAIVYALGLTPAGVNAFESIALMSVEAFGVCSNQETPSATLYTKFNKPQCVSKLGESEAWERKAYAS
jgi:hypothetical protein